METDFHPIPFACYSAARATATGTPYGNGNGMLETGFYAQSVTNNLHHPDASPKGPASERNYIVFILAVLTEIVNIARTVKC